MKYFLSIAAAILLTIYQIPQIVRIIRRRSSEDFSLPAYAIVWSGLACYVGATWGTPANIAAWVSLANVSVLAAVIVYYRRKPRKHKRPNRPKTRTARPPVSN